MTKPTSTTVEDRIRLAYKAARKRRGKDGESVTGAAYDVARAFGITCEAVRRIVGKGSPDVAGERQ
jgi:hypothetical protein